MQTRIEALPLRAMIDAIPVGLAVVDADGRMVLANRSVQKQFGYAEQELIGQPAAMLLPERLKGSHPLQMCSEAVVPEGPPAQPLTDLFGRRKDGSEFPLEIGLNTIETPSGSLLIAALSDITVRKHLEYNFSQIIEASPVGKLVVDSAGLIQLANARLCRLFGYTREELLGQKLEMLVPSEARRAHATQRAAFIDHPHTRAMGAGLDLCGLRSDGSEIAVEVGLSPIRTDSGIAILAAVVDVSERKQMEQHLRKLNTDLDEFTYIASHDLHAPLQGIASLAEWIAEDLAGGPHDEVHKNLARIGLRIRRMERLIDDLLLYARAGRAEREGSQFALLMMDLNLFKQVNDNLGHEAGDKVLAEIGQRYRSMSRKSDTIARLGGDEFTCIPHGVDSISSATAYAEKIVAAVGEPLAIDDSIVQVGVSIGIALYPQHGADASTLLCNADDAMYRAKRSLRSYAVHEEAGVQRGPRLASHRWAITCPRPSTPTSCIWCISPPSTS